MSLPFRFLSLAPLFYLFFRVTCLGVLQYNEEVFDIREKKRGLQQLSSTFNDLAIKWLMRMEYLNY